jgi:cytochrome c oxidase assembly protein subunit 11
MSVTVANRQMLTKLVIVACAMFGFGFALVPLYKKVCEAIGLNSIAAADELVNTQVDVTRWVTVEFDANTRALPWSFIPSQSSLKIHPGELAQAMYEVRNNTDRPVTGQAIASFGPQVAGRYFKKLECFCFRQQVLAPHEVRKMQVSFVVESGLPQDIGTVTLSYTFFEVEGTGKPPPADG